MKKIISSLLLSGIILSCQNPVAPPTINRTVEAVKTIKQDVPVFKDFVGSIYGYKDIPIRARVEGFLESIDFDEGTMVKKGQLLYTIDSQPFQAAVAEAKSKVAEAETKLVNAENELARYKPLANSKAVSQSDVDAAQATRDAAEASLNAAKANLRMSEINLSYASMKSPLDGIIGRTSARVGEYVGKDPNPVILNTVSRLDTVRVEFFLSEAQYLEIAKSLITLKNQQVSGRNYKTLAHLFLADGTEYSEPGHVDFVDRNINTSTGSMLVQASFPNPHLLLRPGLYARIRIQYGLEKDVVLVPQKCIIETQGQYAVKIVTDSNIIETKQVILGDKVNNMWVVQKGLEANQTVVIEGLQQAQTGDQVTVKLIEFKSSL